MMRSLMKRFSHLFLPLSVMALLIIINLVKGADYFRITMVNGAFYGNIPNIFFGASVIISIGMTLVTAAARSGHQHRESATITSAVFVQYVLQANEVTLLTILVAFLLSSSSAWPRRVQRHLSRFVQPMVASSSLHGQVHSHDDGKLSHPGKRFVEQDRHRGPGISIQTPSFSRSSSRAHRSALQDDESRLYVEAVANPNAARLNGINRRRSSF